MNNHRLPVWSEVYRACDQNSGMLVVLSRSDHNPPRYSFRVGTEFEPRQGQQDPILRLFVNPVISGQTEERVELDDTFDRLQVLLDQTREWIVEDAANYTSKAYPSTKRVGKTEKDKDRKRTGSGKRAQP